MKTGIMTLMRNYLDNADVIVTLDGYWMLGTLEAIAYAYNIRLTDEEKREIVQTLLSEY